jgi:hypothetical protein
LTGEISTNKGRLADACCTPEEGLFKGVDEEQGRSWSCISAFPVGCARQSPSFHIKNLDVNLKALYNKNETHTSLLVETFFTLENVLFAVIVFFTTGEGVLSLLNEALA